MVNTHYRALRRSLICATVAIGVLTLAGCGGSGASSAAGPLAQASDRNSDAELSGAQITDQTPGPSPFIERVSVRLTNSSRLASVEFIIQPKPGSVSKAVDVSYTSVALAARGYTAEGSTEVVTPVFGLYAGYTNQVTLNLRFEDGSIQALTTSITTQDYTDPTGIYQHPTILQQRAAGSSLDFNFFYIKSALGPPVILDTDGEIRWSAPGVVNAMSTALQGDEFVIGDPSSPVIDRIRLDGTVTAGALADSSVTMFHHNIDFGNIGLLVDVNSQTNGVQNIESNVMEMTDQGAILQHWDLAAILSAYMLSQGDDASAFVRPGVDWFHNNSAAYDPSDDSVIISSRENFVIKLDYLTGRIIWILGDPTKYWYTFPSLRAKAVTLAPGGLYPIGQHAVSITADGHLMLFNDGLGSINQPGGAPAGETRTFSAVSAYSVDTTTMTAQNVWNFENGKSVYSSICSSAYGAQGHSILIDYATADNDTLAQLIGLDENHNMVFDFQYPTQECNTSWNAVPIPLESLTIQ